MLYSRLLVLPLALLLCGFFDPYHFKDAASGLAIDPPYSYVVAPLGTDPAKSTAKVLVGIFRHDEADIANPTPPFCVMALHERADNALTQDELNQRTRGPAYRDGMMQLLEVSFAILEDEPIELDGVMGHQFILEENGASGELDDMLHIQSIFDIPSARMTLSCATARTDLTTNLVGFGLIRDSITLP